MGKPTGFLEYNRIEDPMLEIKNRIDNFEDFHGQLNVKERETQGARCMDCGVPLCQSGMELKGKIVGCPLHNVIPEWNDEVYHGHIGHALSRVLKTNNFPEFTGRVCPALCEKTCICGLNDSPVTIRENELYVIERAFEEGLVKPRIPARRSGKTVAVVGSGPSGLAVADQLNHRGHSVVVYEREERIGGLMMYGIPNMKLPKEIIRRRKDLMELEGVVFKTGINIGVDVSSEELLSEYDAVVMCCGAKKPRAMALEGLENVDGVRYAVDFLTEATKELLNDQLPSEEKKSSIEKSVYKKDVVIVGGGDTAIDCVATCVRLGASSVKQLIRKPCPPLTRSEDNPWPEYPMTLETGYGQLEAIYAYGRDPRIYQTVIKSYETDKSGKLKSIRTEKTASDGTKTEDKLKCDLLLLATGFAGCEDYVIDSFSLCRSKRGNIETAINSYQTNIQKIFACGDVQTGQSLVVRAIEQGRRCAREVDKFLLGYSNM